MRSSIVYRHSSEVIFFNSQAQDIYKSLHEQLGFLSWDNCLKFEKNVSDILYNIPIDE